MTTSDNSPTSSSPGADGSNRLSAARDWLSDRADTSLGRLALLWFRRYFEASRNSGAAAASYATLSVLPAALVIIAIFDQASGNENALAERLISHMNLDGPTASLVRDLFGTTSNNLLAASFTVVIGFLIWGLSIGQLYQDVYARSWRIHVGTATDQVQFTIWFFVFTGVIALLTVVASERDAHGHLATGRGQQLVGPVVETEMLDRFCELDLRRLPGRLPCAAHGTQSATGCGASNVALLWLEA